MTISPFDPLLLDPRLSDPSIQAALAIMARKKRLALAAQESQRVVTPLTTQAKYLEKLGITFQPKQQRFAESTADICIYGGAAFAGKTHALLLEPLKHIDNKDFGAVFFRRTYSRITQEGGIWDESQKLYRPLGAEPNKSELGWTFPSGASMSSAHLQHEGDEFSYYGAQICLLCFDQLEEFSANQFFYMVGRNRSTCGVKPYCRATCLSGDTIIAAADGRLRRLADCSVSDPLLSISLPGAESFSEHPTHRFCRSVNDALRVITNCSELVCTRDHRFFRWSPTGPQEVRVEHLQAGDYLAAPRTLPHGTNAYDSDESYLVGYTIGDGGLTGRQHIRRILWCEQWETHARYIASIAEHVFSTKIGMHQRKGVQAFNIYTTRSTAATERFIDGYADALKAAQMRAIPEHLTDGDPATIQALLQGIFDAEAYVGTDRIGLAVVSPILVQQISMLLRRWGIIARFDVQDPKAPRRRVYRLTMQGHQAVDFITHIGFRLPGKQKAALALIERFKAQTGGIRGRDTDVIPFDRHALFHLRSFFGKLWWNPMHAIRRETAEHVLTAAVISGVSAEPLEQWCQFTWERVQRVEPFGELQVYDVTMPTAHTYVSGGIISHNCNPDPDSWLADFLGWWIDEKGDPIPERAGATRYFIRLPNEELAWADTADELYTTYGKDAFPQSASFIPGTLDDNPIGRQLDPSYESKLMLQVGYLRQRLRYGNWRARPTAGDFFKRYWFEIVDVAPAQMRVVRFWDRAATEPNPENRDPDWTSGFKMGQGQDGYYYILDVRRDRVGPGQVERLVKQTANEDGPQVEIGLEQEPGASGKVDAFYLARQLAGYRVKVYPKRIDKVTAASPLASQASIGNVRMIRGPWNKPMLDQYENFPGGRHDDDVDSGSGALGVLTGVLKGTTGGVLHRFRPV